MQTPQKAGCQQPGGEGSIRVYLRIRPSDDPTVEPCLNIINDNSIALISDDLKKDDERTFRFTKVFPPSTTQETIFQTISKPLIDEVLKGNSQTSPHAVQVFVYGVTGSGKTHTVTGTAAEPGLSPRSLDTLIRMRDDGLIDKITLAIYEIYNENIYDLLTEEEVGSKKTAKKDEERKKLKIRERDGQFYIEGLKTITLNDIDSSLALLRDSLAHRQVGSTAANRHSSRSHCVLSVGVWKNEECTHFDLVDLAGSEKAKKAKTIGTQLREASQINTSLFVFGRCIEMLQRGGRGPLPCRDSALTKLLSDVFMGRRKGTMIVAASAKETEREETLQVLRFTAVASDVFIAPRSTQCSKRKREQTDPAREATFAKALVQIAKDCKQLKDEKKELELKVAELQKKLAEAEFSIRAEVVNELSEKFEAERKRFSERANESAGALESKYSEKVNTLLKALEEIKSEQLSRRENEKLLMEKNQELLKKIEAIEKEKSELQKEVEDERANKRMKLEEDERKKEEANKERERKKQAEKEREEQERLKREQQQKEEQERRRQEEKKRKEKEEQKKREREEKERKEEEERKKREQEEKERKEEEERKEREEKERKEEEEKKKREQEERERKEKEEKERKKQEKEERAKKKKEEQEKKRREKIERDKKKKEEQERKKREREEERERKKKEKEAKTKRETENQTEENEESDDIILIDDPKETKSGSKKVNEVKEMRDSIANLFGQSKLDGALRSFKQNENQFSLKSLIEKEPQSGFDFKSLFGASIQHAPKRTYKKIKIGK